MSLPQQISFFAPFYSRRVRSRRVGDGFGMLTISSPACSDPIRCHDGCGLRRLGYWKGCGTGMRSLGRSCKTPRLTKMTFCYYTCRDVFSGETPTEMTDECQSNAVQYRASSAKILNIRRSCLTDTEGKPCKPAISDSELV